jgi:hypothetical protein
MYLQDPLFKVESLLRPFFLSGSRILHPLSPVKVDVRIPFDPDTVPDVNIAGPVDHHSGLNIDIFPIGAEQKSVLEIDQRVPESLFLHAKTFP